LGKGAGGGRTFFFTHARWEGYVHLIESLLSSGRSALVLALEILLAIKLELL
jgi:hypothetical protein